ncbi:MAG: T9SS type A sorting domain-containing protein, partial [Flavobacteriaceae bacterium]|nr:T9SS type A sorting domain-containing protein [Flavobacteriaceae bacterium]
WKHGDVWDIEDSSSNKDWSIVRINSNVTTDKSHTQLGMIIEDNQSLTVNTDRDINNTWYLELNGSLELNDDAQLIQSMTSDLVTGANGRILRRQDGSSNVYWYTYMSSPVGALGVTTLSDNNAATNNTNNTAFQFNNLKEGDGSLVQFTNAYNEVGKISTRWMYTFQNGLTYYDWAHYTQTTNLDPGVGYVHKGTGNAGTTQEYLFEGKPNNGTILIAADDVDGDSGNESQADVTLTSTLIGNPYPSAIDAHTFIDDNAGVIEGTLYLWQQWAGDNHILREYDGGYATLNLMTKIRAYQFEGLNGDNNGIQNGTKTPTRYLPVGQSFLTEVIADGNIEFNNAQRVFKKEANGETVFFRDAERNTKGKEDNKETMALMRLDFSTSNGLKREIVLGFSNFTTEGYDYGYDAKMFETKTEDMFTMWKGHDMIAHAYPSIHPTNVIPVGINVTGIYTYKIKATAFDNMDPAQKIYLRDKYTDTYFDLRSKEAYDFTSERGRIEDRFEIVFMGQKSKNSSIDLSESINIYFNNTTDMLYVKGLETSAESLTLINILGQQVMVINTPSKETLSNGIHMTNLNTGVYIVSITTTNKNTIEKKIKID